MNEKSNKEFSENSNTKSSQKFGPASNSPFASSGEGRRRSEGQVQRAGRRGVHRVRGLFPSSPGRCPGQSRPDVSPDDA